MQAGRLHMAGASRPQPWRHPNARTPYRQGSLARRHYSLAVAPRTLEQQQEEDALDMAPAHTPQEDTNATPSTSGRQEPPGPLPTQQEVLELRPASPPAPEAASSAATLLAAASGRLQRPSLPRGIPQAPSPSGGGVEGSSSPSSSSTSSMSEGSGEPAASAKAPPEPPLNPWLALTGRVNRGHFWHTRIDSSRQQQWSTGTAPVAEQAAVEPAGAAQRSLNGSAGALQPSPLTEGSPGTAEAHQVEAPSASAQAAPGLQPEAHPSHHAAHILYQHEAAASASASTTISISGDGGDGGDSGVDGSQAGSQQPLVNRRRQRMGAFTYLPTGRHGAESSRDGGGGEGARLNGGPTSSTSGAIMAAARLAVEQPAPPQRPTPDEQSDASARSSGAASTSAAAGGTDALTALRRSRGNGFAHAPSEAGLSARIASAPEWFALRRIFEASQQRLNIVHIAALMTRLARLLTSPPRMLMVEERAALGKFVRALQAHGLGLVAGVDGGTAVALLHSMAELQRDMRLPADQGLASALLVFSAPFMHSLKPRELASMLWSAGKLGVQPHSSWWDALWEAGEPGLGALGASDLAVAVYGLASLQVVPPQPWQSSLLDACRDALPDLRSQELSMLLLSLGRLRLRPGSAWMEDALAEVRERLEMLDPQSLANIIWALARLRHGPDRAWMSDFYIASYQLLNSFNPQELAATAWALASLRLWPSDQWLDEFFDHTQAKMAEMSPGHCALMGWALARMGVRPPQSWLRAYCGQLLHHKARFSRQRLNQVMYALSGFKVAQLPGWRAELYSASGMRVPRQRRPRYESAPGTPSSSSVASSRSRLFAGP